MHRIVKTGYIDMAHRIRGHKGKCRFLHGHTWKIELSVSCEDDQLDELGMVVDFGVLKKKFFELVDSRFDHSCLLSEDDQKAILAGQHETPESSTVQRHASLDHLESDLGLGGLGAIGAGLNVHFLEGNLTAETLSKFLYDMAVYIPIVTGRRVRVDYVRVYEQLHPTESYAEYRLSGEKGC